MEIILKVPDSIPLDDRTTIDFVAFLQAVVNRRCVGALRYGDRPDKLQRYMRRMTLELRRYRETGNFEQLLNIAVYCFLESQAPQNGKFHFDPSAASATREAMGGNIA